VYYQSSAIALAKRLKVMLLPILFFCYFISYFFIGDFSETAERILTKLFLQTADGPE